MSYIIKYFCTKGVHGVNFLGSGFPSSRSLINWSLETLNAGLQDQKVYRKNHVNLGINGNSLVSQENIEHVSAMLK